jgi:hypothetical protein
MQSTANNRVTWNAFSSLLSNSTRGRGDLFYLNLDISCIALTIASSCSFWLWNEETEWDTWKPDALTQLMVPCRSTLSFWSEILVQRWSFQSNKANNRLWLHNMSIFWRYQCSYVSPQLLELFTVWCGARGSVVVEVLCCMPEGRGFETRLGEWILSMYLIFPAALCPGAYSASNRYEYQKQKSNINGK